jgi:1-deoxy-D-xylulose-5-phosphate reductoisomerase
VGLTAHRDAAGLDRLASELEPEFVVLSGGDPPQEELTWSGPWYRGSDALREAAADSAVDVVLNGIVGAAGLEPTLAALRAGKRVALANKESLVVGGGLVLEAARSGGGELVPVDSEHSAVHRCLAGRRAEDVRRLVLTASGGPFRTLSAEELSRVGPEEALQHPTWDMGRKITVDSATLANKALEVVEAHHLFGIPFDRIDVVVHPQSTVHSMVEFRDGSVLAEMEENTMEGPVLYALTYPDALLEEPRSFDPVAASPLTFEPVREDAFPMFGLGVAAGRRGGTAPAVYNAANEVAVRAFLDGELDFPGIPRVVEGCLETVDAGSAGEIEELWTADRTARERAKELVSRC